MRTEAPYEHQGIAGHVLATGLGLLAAKGCTRLKVSSDGGLYTRAGFVAGPSVWLTRRVTQP
jgi:predicted N-acetyltransferase YhbS